MAKQKLKDEDYLKLGKQFQDMLEENYAVLKPAWPKRIKISVIRGFFSGMAGVVGATLGIAVLIFVLYLFRGVPVIGNFFTTVADTLSK